MHVTGGGATWQPTLVSSLALRASPPSKIVGTMVTVVLFVVPCIGVLLETPLFGVCMSARDKFKGGLRKRRKSLTIPNLTKTFEDDADHEVQA